jgi:hypothetical protein
MNTAVEAVQEHNVKSTRYCPECSHVGPVSDGARDCCPDGNRAAMVPETIAKQARVGFASLYLSPKQCVQERWQDRCLEIGFKYWRAPDAHGVTCTQEQALELLREVLAVEVEIKP